MTKKTNRSIIRFDLLVMIHLLFSLLFSSCNLNSNQGEQGKNGSKDPESYVTPSVDIHFSIHLPSPLNNNEKVGLEILDEVTGLPYNSHLYEMIMVNGQEYSLDLSFPTGSVIQYRYMRIGNSITPEATSGGDQVRYRLLFVKNETLITDFLNTWQDTPFTSTTGSLFGAVLDSASGQPIADILVSAAGNLTFTDANGRFRIDGISPGVHNVVFYALDGRYQTFQQGANIVSGLTTPANVSLTSRSMVKVTFHVTAPNDALGVPIYFAGNLIQLGNTFSDLYGGMSVKAKQLPMLTPQEDGTYLLSIDLYAGTDLRYKFTLGDGYWNAEQQADGGFVVRQLIVPDQSITLEQTIISWRTPGIGPVTFNVSIPTEASPADEKYIQLKSGLWTEPLPLWPLGNGIYLFILFSPLDDSLPISYRFCRNEDCDQAANAESLISEANVTLSMTAQSINVTITEWQNWKPAVQPTEVIAANIPVKSSSYQTWIELTPEMTPSWRVYAPIGISKLSEIGVKTVLLSPQWYFSWENGQVAPIMGKTPFKTDLSSILDSVLGLGMESGLFPRLAPTETIQDAWMSETHSADWWNDWFSSYRQFILNYAQIAAEKQVNWFVIGGKDVMPAFPGGVFADGYASDVPEDFDDQWLQLISEIRSVYNGNLVWAANAQVSMDPLPHFVNLMDALYITVDSPIANNSNPTSDEILFNFSAVMNTQVYDAYISTQKPVIVGLAYPSVDGSATGCLMLDANCSNDGIFLENEIKSYPIDLDEQVLIYNVVLPVLSSQDWINGIALRGFDPTIINMDGASTLNGKPALDVIWYWFSGLIPE